MTFEVTGVLHEKFDTQNLSERFKKREFVLETENGAYKEYIKFQLTQDRCDLIDSSQKGDTIKVSFNLKGKPYQKGSETIYFTNLEAWRIESNTNSSKTSKMPTSDDGFPSLDYIPPVETGGSNNDDLPF